MAGKGNLKGNPNGAGRKIGSRGKWAMLTDEQRIALANQTDGIMPIQFFLSLLRDPNCPIQQKINAANLVAPYLHRKMPIGIDGGAAGKPIFTLQAGQLKGLSEEELSMLYSIMAKLNG